MNQENFDLQFVF